MGLFDTVICEYPLEGGLPKWIKRHPFQTKDLECMMTQYTISKDGMFSDSAWTGKLNFYTDNVVGAGPGIYTENGEDAEYLECVAKIVDGKLVGEIEVHRRSHRAWPSSKMQIFDKPTEDEIKRIRERQSEPLTGKRLYVLWGGQMVGYWGTAVTENDKQICISHETDSQYHHAGDFEILDRRDRDRIFWDSDAEALGREKKKREDWERQSAEFKAFVENI